MKTRIAAALGLIAVTLAIEPASAGDARTRLVSRFSGGDAVHGNSSTFGRTISGNGRFVVFSVGDDALPGDDDTRDVYRRDVRRGRTILVSKNSGGDPAVNSSSDSIAVSQSGRFVAFAVDADNLPGGTGTAEIYLHDAETGKTRLVSKRTDGGFLDGDSDEPSVSAGGRFVAFYSDADNLPGDDAFGNVYVHDRKTGRTRLVSKSSHGVPANGDSGDPSLSANGNRVSFVSGADNLPGGPGIEVYVHVRPSGRTRLVSKTSSGEHLDSGAFPTAGSMSANGRFVGFESAASNLPGRDGTNDVYVHDLKTGRTTLVSKTSVGVPADTGGTAPSVSKSGRFIAFESDAGNLPGAAGFSDSYVYDRNTGRTRLVSQSSSGDVGDEDSFYPSISADGRFVTFTSRADNFSSSDDNLFSNTFIRGPLH